MVSRRADTIREPLAVFAREEQVRPVAQTDRQLWEARRTCAVHATANKIFTRLKYPEGALNGLQVTQRHCPVMIWFATYTVALIPKTRHDGVPAAARAVYSRASAEVSTLVESQLVPI